MNEKVVLKLCNCCKNYKRGNDNIEIIKNVSFCFETGKFYAITGKSGAGKSTLIQLLGLLDKLSSGEIKINGTNTNNLKDREKDIIRNKNIGFIFQSFYLNQNLNGIANILLPTLVNEKLTEKEALKKASILIDMLGISNRKNHYPNELSGGEQQRVAIARALINDPDIILADEPTGNLDGENEKNVFEILKNMSKDGKCVIVVSHNKEIKKYADVLLKLEDGELKVI